jgi:hypothetical protein
MQGFQLIMRLPAAPPLRLQKDLAVETAAWLHDFPRTGLMPPTLVLPGIDTINVSAVDVIRLGHGYIANARSVLIEMHTLITRGVPHISMLLNGHDAPFGESAFPIQGIIRGMAKPGARSLLLHEYA